MLRKQARISSERFDEILKSGSKITSAFFVVHYAKTTDISHTAAVAPKKVAPKATQRNYLRRKVYHALRSHSARVRGFDAIVIAKATVRDASSVELEKEIGRLFAQITSRSL